MFNTRRSQERIDDLLAENARLADEVQRQRRTIAQRTTERDEAREELEQATVTAYVLHAADGRPPEEFATSGAAHNAARDLAWSEGVEPRVTHEGEPERLLLGVKPPGGPVRMPKLRVRF
jgi:hypothetical protein